MSHLRLSGINTNRYNIVLQARTVGKDAATKFYHNVGFEETSPVERESELPTVVFPEFGDVLSKGTTSNTDFMHFIWNAEDISIFKNSTGTFGRIKVLARQYLIQYAELDSDKNQESFDFPFAAVRNHLMLLASELDFFFLPFRRDADLYDYLRPRAGYEGRYDVQITVREKRLVSDGKWINDASIDFFIRW